MKCADAAALVEKLADGEASTEEMALAKAHLTECAECRSHYAFVQHLAAASDKIDFPEPPEAYWDHFPAKVVARLRENEPDGFWARLLAPNVLRWGALAATLTVAVAVGTTLVRDGELDGAPSSTISTGSTASTGAPVPEPTGESEPLAAFDTAAAQDESVRGDDPTRKAPPAAARVVSPPASGPTPAMAPATARDEAPHSGEAFGVEASAGGVAGNTPQPQERLRQRSVVAAPPPRAQNDATETSPRAERAEAAVPERALESQEIVAAAEDALAESPEAVSRDASAAEVAFLELERASSTVGTAGTRATRATGRRNDVSSTVMVDGCVSWRGYLELYPVSARANDARYELARCMLRRYEVSPTDAGRLEALSDADAFVDKESDGPRAEEIRQRAAPLRVR